MSGLKSPTNSETGRKTTLRKTGTVTLQERWKVSYDEPLGEGGYAAVYKGLDLKECQTVAIKIYKTDDACLDFANGNFHTSIDIMQNIAHPRASCRATPKKNEFSRAKSGSFDVGTLEEDLRKMSSGGMQAEPSEIISHMDLRGCFVQLLGYSKDHRGFAGIDPESEMLYIILELGDMSFEDKLADAKESEAGQLTREELRDLQWTLVCIVCGLHAEGYVHLDIKPFNIMLFNGKQGRKQWKLIDLDGAMKTGSLVNSTQVTFTPQYMPPELAAALSKRTKEEVEDVVHDMFTTSRLMDVWSVGICALEAIFFLPVLEPWYIEWREETGSDEKYLKWLADYTTDPIVSGDMHEMLSSIDPDMCEMLEGMLSKDPANRFCIAQCLTSKWFEPLRDELWKLAALDRPVSPQKSLGNRIKSATGSHKSHACSLQ